MHGTRVVVFPLVAGLVGVALAGVLASQAVTSTPPAAPVRPVTETLHGVAVTDPYRWMEDGGQEFTDWLKAQDAYTPPFSSEYRAGRRSRPNCGRWRRTEG